MSGGATFTVNVRSHLSQVLVRWQVHLPAVHRLPSRARAWPTPRRCTWDDRSDGFVSDTAGQIVVNNPAGTAGTVDVTVVTPGGTSPISAADQFTYVAVPALSISDVTLTEGNSGTKSSPLR